MGFKLTSFSEVVSYGRSLNQVEIKGYHDAQQLSVKITFNREEVAREGLSY